MGTEAKALKLWDTASLLRAKAWWLSYGLAIVGKNETWNNVAAIDMALRAR